MNNSLLAIEPEEKAPDLSPRLREEEAKTLRIVEAIKAVQETAAWGTLKEELFDSLVNVLERELKTEARKDNADTGKLGRISGQLEWAEKFADLSKLSNRYMQQLSNIRLKLNGKTD